MAMYYYASKLNEASCSGCNVKLPPPPTEPAPLPPEQPTLPTDPELLHGPALSYYDSDSYYSLARSNNSTSENSKCLVMNGSINLVVSKPQTSQVNPNAKAAVVDIEYREDGHVATASLDGLIELLHRSTFKSMKSYIFAFVLCSRLYIKPHELLAKLYKRFLNYDCVGEVGSSAASELMHKELSDMMSFVSVLKHWTSMIPNDFRDENVTALFRNITERCAAEHMSPMNAQVSAMLEKLVDRVKTVREYEQSLVEVPRVCHADQLPVGDILTLGLTPWELAQELSTEELYKLSFVGPEEFVQAFVPLQPVKSDNNITIIQVEAKSTKCLEAYANWFNRLTYIVATDILKSVKSKYRARVIEQWVMTARECFNLGNFNSLMAIVGALNMPPVRRLKKTWSRTSAVCGQQLRQLELCVEPSGNHARYRAALAAAPEARRVPLLSVTCRDLHFVNQASPIKLPGNRINFEKCMRLAQRVSAQLSSRRLMQGGSIAMSPPPRRDTPVWRFLNCRPALSEHAMELTSFECEPPVDQHEKERLKRLRVAT